MEHATISIESLSRQHYADPVAVYEEVALAGGFGAVRTGTVEQVSGHLDISGLDEDTKKKVQSILDKAPKKDTKKEK